MEKTAAGTAPATAPTTWPALSLFAVVYTLFVALPAVLDGDFPPRDDLLWGDILDLATPLAVFSALWIVLRRAGAQRDPVLLGALALLAVVWAQGQGMHLAANAINHHLTVNDGDAGRLTEFLDETLSHYLWYAAVVATPGFFLLVAARSPQATVDEAAYEAPAALLFGAILAISSLEADVVPLALPVFAITLISGVLWSRRQRSRLRSPLTRFAAAATAIALAVIVAWGIVHGGWPEPSELGLI